MSLRRRKGGGGQGHEPQAAPRVRGAWTTPAVVVRAPDGSVVGRTTRPTRGPSRRAPARRRVPPPGATGGVLAVPTRAMAGDPASSQVTVQVVVPLAVQVVVPLVVQVVVPHEGR
jgi:hypothetical protein